MEAGANIASTVTALYTDRIEAQGVVRRIYFYFLVCEGATCTWHYFGTDPAVSPPPQPQWPVVEHPDIQFPEDIAYLGEEANEALYDLGRIIAGKIVGFE